MKRIFAFAFLLYTCLQATADTWTDNNGIEWSFFVEGREATYVKPVKSVSGEVIIPGEMDDFYTVRTIASSAFSGCSGLTSVTIPSSVTSIGSNAFGGCFNLTSVTIKSRSILSYSFNSSFSLKTLFGSQVKQYNIPDNITSIGSYTFYGCSGLKNVNISSSVASIGDNAFSGCSNLTSVTINSKSLLSNLHYSSSYSLKNIFGNQVEQYIIGDNITNIVSDAFNGCSGLVCLSMGNSVKSIGLDAFYGCTGLNRVIVQDIAAWCNIDFEGYNANPFYYADHLYSDENTEIYELVIPSSVTSIRDMAFRGCSGLTSVIIPSSVTNIGENAFLDCTGLQKVIVQDISAWSSITFENEHANPLRYSHHLYSDKKTEIYALVIPNGVTSISSYAFYNCSALTSVKIPSSVTSVGSYAFYNCSTLTSVDISSNLTIIDSYAFYGCSGLTSMEIPSSVRDIGSYAFSGCSGLTSVNIPLGVTSIKEATFSGCKKLTNVTIPNSVTIIGVEAFSGCYNLSSIILQEGLETIAVGAFSFCKSLHSVVLPNSVSRICGESFGFCSSLTSFTISESVNYILDYPFISCNNLTSLIIKRKTPIRLDNNIFGAFADNATLYVPIGCKKAYESANYWETFKEIVEINMEDLSEETIVPATLSIEDFSISAGETKEMLIDLNNPDTEATLVQFDLRLPTGLSIAMENGEPIVDIAGRTTWRKHSLQTNDLGGVTRFLLASNSNAVITGTSDAIISIMLMAGSNFNGGAITLEEQLIVAPDASETYPDDYTYSIVAGSVPPANNIIFADAAVKALCVENWDTNGDGELSEDEAAAVTDIGTVFQNNTQITSFDEISYFTGLTSIASQAFNGCTGLTSITIPENITSIGMGAFKDCTGLTKAEFASIEDLCSMVFEDYGANPLVNAHHLYINGEEITELVIPNSVTTIGTFAFRGCSSLTSATIPNSVTEIGVGIFSDCTALASVSLPENLTKISVGMFYGCKNLASIIIPEGVTSIGRNAFYGCSSLTSLTIPEGVTSIGSSAFNGCSSLTSVYVKMETPPAIKSTVFSNRANATLYVPYGCSEAYEATAYWNEFKKIVEMGAPETDIAAKVGMVLPWGTEQAWEMKYMFFVGTDSEPEADGSGHAWYEKEYDDESWETLSGPIANISDWFSSVNTLWNTEGHESSSYCLRRTFHLDEVDEQGYTFLSQHDDDLKVWINGELVVDAGFDGTLHCHHIPASKFHEGDNTLAISVNDFGGEAFLDYSLSHLFFLQNVETEKYLNAGNEWGTHAVLADEPLPVQLYKQLDGSYTIFFPVRSYNQHLLFMDESMSDVYVDYAGQEAPACPYWNITDAGNGNYYIQMLNESDTYLGNDPDREPDNDVDGDVTSGKNVTWTLVPEGLHTQAQAERLQELITQANALHIDTNKAQAVLDDENSTYTEMLAQILQVDGWINEGIWFEDEKVKELCVANWDTSEDGELSRIEAGTVADLGEVFKGNTEITSFNELQYFTRLTSISDEAFSHCSSLETVVLPSTAIMGENMFEGCSKLKSVTFLSGDPGEKHFANNFQGVPDDVLFVIPEGTAESYLKRGYRNLSDKGALGKVRELFENQVNRISNDIVANVADGDKDALNAAISAAREIVETAEDYMTIYQQIDAIKDAAKAYLATAALTEDLDVTGAMITNPDNDYFDIGWTIGFLGMNNGWQNANYSNEDCTIDSFVESWRPGEALSDGRHSQTIKNLPAGKYRLDVKAIATWQDDPEQEVTGVCLFMGDQSTPLATANEKPQFFSVEFTNEETQDVEIGLKVENTTANWVALDDVRLYLRVGKLPGDANGDGYVTIADVMAVVNYILGNTPKDFDFDAANVNNDEVITIADAVSLVKMILEMP